MHPDLGALLDFWNRKRAGRRMPARDDFDVFELRAWLGHLHLVEVIDGGRDFLHRIYGTDLAVMFGIDLTGKGLDAIPEVARDSVRRAYAAACASREPVVVEDDPILQSNVQRVEDLILPLSTNGRVVDRLLIGTACIARPREIVQAPDKRPKETGLAPDERRRAVRIAVLWGGMLEIGEEWESCVILDCSSLGAQLRLDRQPIPDVPLAIAFADVPPVRARVVWQGGGRAGIEFTSG